MDLWIVVIILLAIAIILLLVSFFAKEKEDALLTEVSDFTLQMTADMQALKQKVSRLEDTMGAETEKEDEHQIKKLNAVTKEHILALYKKGKTFDEIADQLELPETTVQLVIDNHHDTLQ